MLSLLREVYGEIVQLCPSLVSKAIEALCTAAAVCMGSKEQYQTVTPILLCLRDWFMLLPSLKEASWLSPSAITAVFEVEYLERREAGVLQSVSFAVA